MDIIPKVGEKKLQNKNSGRTSAEVYYVQYRPLGVRTDVIYYYQQYYYYRGVLSIFNLSSMNHHRPCSNEPVRQNVYGGEAPMSYCFEFLFSFVVIV